MEADRQKLKANVRQWQVVSGGCAPLAERPAPPSKKGNLKAAIPLWRAVSPCDVPHVQFYYGMSVGRR